MTDTNPQDKWFDEVREEWQKGCQADLDLPTCYCKGCEDWRRRWTEAPRMPHTDLGRCLCVGCRYDRSKPPTRKLPRKVETSLVIVRAMWDGMLKGYKTGYKVGLSDGSLPPWLQNDIDAYYARTRGW